MYHTNYEGDGSRCDEAAVDGGEFCEIHKDLKLCKTSGLRYMFGGTSLLLDWETVPPHVVDEPAWGDPPRTARAEYCPGDRCRNLWRDTRNRITRDEAVDKTIEGRPSDRYSIIKDYNNTGHTVVYDKKLHRRLTNR